MNVNEITEIVNALAPAGKAVHSTASLYLVSEMLTPICAVVTILGSITLITRAIRKHEERKTIRDYREELKSIGQDADGCLKTSYMEWAQASELKEAYTNWQYKNSQIVTRFSATTRHVNAEKVDELIKFLRGL